MKSDNPAFKIDTFDTMAHSRGYSRTDSMTVSGTINKTSFLLLLAFATATYTWRQAMTGVMPGGLMTVGIVGGLICAIAIAFKKEWSPVLAPAYALLEGLALGGISGIMALQYSGIVYQAVGLTFGTLAVMLLAYKSGLIRATEGFKAAVISATGAICLFYLVTMVVGLFGVTIPYIHEGGVLGIGLSLLVTGVAAMNLILDFDFIESYEGKLPAYMEWYGAFGLMVTLVWLYIEFLKLLAKLNRRD